MADQGNFLTTDYQIRAIKTFSTFSVGDVHVCAWSMLSTVWVEDWYSSVFMLLYKLMDIIYIIDIIYMTELKCIQPEYLLIYSHHDT